MRTACGQENALTDFQRKLKIQSCRINLKSGGNGSAPSEFVRFEAVEFPQSKIYYFEPLDEYVPTYHEPFTLIQEAVINAALETEQALEEIVALTLSGTLDYQACDDAICYLPVSVPISFTLEFQHLDYQHSIQR